MAYYLLTVLEQDGGVEVQRLVKDLFRSRVRWLAVEVAYCGGAENAGFAYVIVDVPVPMARREGGLGSVNVVTGGHSTVLYQLKCAVFEPFVKESVVSHPFEP